MVAQLLFPQMPTMKRNTICSRCKKPLSDPKSVEAGMGAICRGHTGKGNTMTDNANRTEFSDQFDGSIPFTKALHMRRNGNEGDADHDRSSVVTNVPHLVVHHSPTGYEFGYGGSGAADLALNACQLYLNIVQYSGQKTKCYDGHCWTLAWMLHQEFKRSFIAGVNWRIGDDVPFEKMERWFQSQMTYELLRQCAATENELIEE